MKGLVDISILMLEEIVIPLDQNFDTSSIMYYLILNVHLSLNFHNNSLLYLLQRVFLASVLASQGFPNSLLLYWLQKRYKKLFLSGTLTFLDKHRVFSSGISKFQKLFSLVRKSLFHKIRVHFFIFALEFKTFAKKTKSAFALR